MSLELKPNNEKEYIPEIMTWEEYAAHNRHANPYVFELKKGGKELVYFGAMHSNDPSNPMFDQIRAKFAETRPDSMFVEGWAHLEEIKADPERYARGIEMMKNATYEEVIQKSGEAGLGLKLAVDAGIDFYSPEPKFSDEVAHILEQGFTKEEAFVEYVHRDLYQYYRNHEKIPVEQYLESNIIKSFKDATNWEGFDYSIEHLEKIGKEIWGDKADIRVPDFSSERTNPVPEEEEFKTRVTEVAKASSKFRDVYMVKALKDALKTHNKPFVIFGSSHAYMQRPALKKLFAEKGQ
jgi:hypothetical protein